MLISILVLSNDVESRNLVVKWLRINGYMTDVCDDIVSCINLYKERKYDLVLIHHDDQTFDALQFARILRISLKQSSPKFVAFCSVNCRLARDVSEGGVFDALLFQPFNYETLQRTVSTVLENSLRRQTHEQSTLIWQQRGLDARPKALVLPDPTPEQAQVIEWCFDIARANEADIILTTASCTVTMIEVAREAPGCECLPVVDQSNQFGSTPDAIFQLSQIESWTAVAHAIVEHKQRRARVARTFSRAADAADRLLVHLFVSNRGLTPRLDPNNPACISYQAFGQWPASQLMSQGLSSPACCHEHSSIVCIVARVASRGD